MAEDTKKWAVIAYYIGLAGDSKVYEYKTEKGARNALAKHFRNDILACQQTHTNIDMANTYNNGGYAQISYGEGPHMGLKVRKFEVVPVSRNKK